MGGEGEGKVRYRNEEWVGGSSSPLNTRKKRRAAVRRAANRMNPRKAPMPVCTGSGSGVYRPRTGKYPGQKW